MKFKPILSILAIFIMSISCVNKDMDLEKLDSEVTVVPGLTSTVLVNDSMTARLEDVIKQAPGYDPSLEEYRADAQGNYGMDILPDFTSTYSKKKEFDIKQYVKGLVDKVKTLAAVVTIEVENGVALPFYVTVESDGEEETGYKIPSNGKSSFDISYKNVIDVREIEVFITTSYKKGTPVTLNKYDQIKVTIPQVVVTIPDGITIKL